MEDCLDLPQVRRHSHPLSDRRDIGPWADITGCATCGLGLLGLFFTSSRWVDRRVETVRFVDDRIAHWRVSADFVIPSAPVLVEPDGTALSVLPITLMRRKTLINFDLRDARDKPMPLLGLRQNQALTKAVVRAWAAAALPHRDGPDASTLDVLDDLVDGDQRELLVAYEQLQHANTGGLGFLARDEDFKLVVDRLADNLFLYVLLEGQPGCRRIIKWSYDEPLSLRYRRSGYVRADQSDMGMPSYRENQWALPSWKPVVWLAALGWTPTVVRFPVPAAEACASFHFGVEAPEGATIESATLLAGRPNLDPSRDHDR